MNVLVLVHSELPLQLKSQCAINRKMNNCVGHTLPQQALFRPSVVERHNTACQRSSGNILCTVPSASKAEDVPSLKPFLSSRFLGKTPYAGKGNPLKKNLRTVTMSPQALLAADPASEVSYSYCIWQHMNILAVSFTGCYLIVGFQMTR